MGRKTFLRGAVILGIAGLIVQVLGAVFRIPLANIIGDDGMGYYQTVYPIYVFLLVFSTNGAPAAISKMTSERLAAGRADEAHRVFKLSFIVMLAFGAICSSVFFFGAEKIIEAMDVHENSYYAMVAISPALLLIPIMSVYRGYFQGMQEMGPTAASQLTEQTVRVAAGLGLAVLLLHKGIEYAAAGATLGTAIGPVAGILLIAAIYYIRRSGILRTVKNDEEKYGDKEESGKILKTLAMIAVPVTIGVSIYPVMNLADAILVIRRLKFTGLSEDAANALYGQLTGFAGPIINIPMALALSMALSMVPAIAAANSSKDLEFLNENVKLGLRTSMIVGAPCSFGLIVLAGPIMNLLYPLQAESAYNAAGPLIVLSAGIIFLCVAQTMAGVLQGLGKIGVAVLSLTAGFIVKCIATYCLTADMRFNIAGAATGSVLGFITTAVISFAAVCYLTRIRFDFISSVVKPLAAGLVMGIIVLASHRGLSLLISGRLATAIAVCVGAAVYIVVLLKIKAIAESEIVMLPKGVKLTALLKKIKLL